MEDNDIVSTRELAKLVTGELTKIELLSDGCCIYRVPKKVSKLKPEAYTPQLVSIGPFHHGKEELKAMEYHKRRYMIDFLKWSDANLEDFITCVKKSERRLRDCYAESFQEEFSSDGFVKMVLVDAIFLITFLLIQAFPRWRSSGDRIFGKPQLINELRHDIIMLENQLPFFILDDLFQLSNIPQRVRLPGGLSLIQLTHCFLRGGWGNWVTRDILEQCDFSQVHHFLDFLRICQQPTNMKPKTTLEKLSSLKVTGLYQAGVKFQLQPSGNKFDIEFKNGILKIPHFKLDQEVEILLRNLQIFEDCHFDEIYLNDYITLMSLLITDDKDLEIVDGSGNIVENCLSEDAAVFFTSIDTRVNRNGFYFSDIHDDLIAYCKKPWKKWMANLKQNYFNTPWAGISVAAAVFLLLLTIIQTVCSILQI